jgi:hypothetical protein
LFFGVLIVLAFRCIFLPVNVASAVKGSIMGRPDIARMVHEGDGAMLTASVDGVTVSSLLSALESSVL